MSSNWIRLPERRDRLLLLGTVALFLAEKLAESAKNSNFIQRIQHNPESKKRRFSFRTIGFRIYRIIRNWIVGKSEDIIAAFRETIAILDPKPVVPTGQLD